MYTVQERFADVRAAAGQPGAGPLLGLSVPPHLHHLLEPRGQYEQWHYECGYTLSPAQVSLDINIWHRWMHTHRLGLLLQHDHPLPKYLLTTSSNGRYHPVQCRKAASKVTLAPHGDQSSLVDCIPGVRSDQVLGGLLPAREPLLRQVHPRPGHGHGAAHQLLRHPRDQQGGDE